MWLAVLLQFIDNPRFSYGLKAIMFLLKIIMLDANNNVFLHKTPVGLLLALFFPWPRQALIAGHREGLV